MDERASAPQALEAPRRALLLGLLGLSWLLAACVQPPLSADRRPSSSFPRSKQTEVGQRVEALVAAHPGKTAFYVLGSGLDAFAARIHLIDQAENAVDVQYYIFDDDVTGNFVLSRLLRAADRGVRVRILVDHLGSLAMEHALAAAEAHENVEARFFNPVARGPLNGLARFGDLLWRGRLLNHRMHNKMLAVDGAAAVVGGRNIGDAYFDAAPEANFADLDLFAMGPILRDLGNSFDQYWNSPFVVPASGWGGLDTGAEELAELRRELAAHESETRASEWAERVRGSRIALQIERGEVPLLWAEGRSVADLPRKIVARGDAVDDTLLVTRLRPYFHDASQELLVVSPYFVPRDGGVAYLGGAAARGARVVVLTNSLAANDVPAVHSAYAPYRKALLEAGVELHEMRHTGETWSHAERSGLFGSSSAALHAKSFVIDGRYVFVGSLNLDPRSVDLNTELGLVVDSEELARRQAGVMERMIQGDVSWALSLDEDGELCWTGGEGEVFTREPETSWWGRLGVHLLGWLPIEGQL